jgi:hypothetical protein
MRRAGLWLAVAVFGLTTALSLQGANLAGVTLPDTETVGGTMLVLNGMGLRTKLMVKVYVAGLYLAQKSSDADTVIKSDAPKRIILHFVRGVSKDQMVDAFDHSFDDNAPDAKKSMKAETDRLLGAFEPLKEGDQMVFTYVPGTGTTLTINGRDKVTIAGPAFGQMLFSLWLGPKPPNAGLKQGLLGKS